MCIRDRSLDKLEKAINKTKTADLKVDGGKISGTADNAKSGQWLFLSVPYDSGFSATINGKSAEIYRSMSGFMAVKLEEGKNDITFSFCPKGLKPGIVLSVAGFAALALYIISVSYTHLDVYKRQLLNKICQWQRNTL